MGKISTRPDEVSHNDCTKSSVARQTPFLMLTAEYLGNGGFADTFSVFCLGELGRFCQYSELRISKQILIKLRHQKRVGLGCKKT